MPASPNVPSAPPLTPPMQMMQLITGGVWLTKALYIAAKLGIADLVAEGPQTSEALAQATGTHGPSLYRVLRALASVGVFAEDAQGRFGLTPLAATLQSGPGSLRGLAVMWGEPWHWEAWGGFLHSIQTGQSGWKHVFGQEVFAYLAHHSAQAAVFHEAMRGFSGPEAVATASAYDFSEIATLVDVGGGHGLVLATILQAHPRMRGVLFELPHAVEGARTVLTEAGVAERCTMVTGDFFDAIPRGGDAYLLKRIIHDWEDAQAVTILTNCRRAIPPHGKLLVVEEVLPSGNQSSPGKLSDLEMLLIGGRERTAAEYRALYTAAGFQLTRVLPTQALLHVIEGVPV